MSDWNSTPSIESGGWVTSPKDAFCSWETKFPKALGSKIVIPNRPADTFLEDDEPQKINSFDCC